MYKLHIKNELVDFQLSAGRKQHPLLIKNTDLRISASRIIYKLFFNLQFATLSPESFIRVISNTGMGQL